MALKDRIDDLERRLAERDSSSPSNAVASNIHVSRDPQPPDVATVAAPTLCQSPSSAASNETYLHNDNSSQSLTSTELSSPQIQVKSSALVHNAGLMLGLTNCLRQDPCSEPEGGRHEPESGDDVDGMGTMSTSTLFLSPQESPCARRGYFGPSSTLYFMRDIQEALKSARTWTLEKSGKDPSIRDHGERSCLLEHVSFKPC